MRKALLDKARSAVITVGEGRGFVVSAPSGHFIDRFVITAAHCLPFLPPCIAAMHLHEKTYRNFLAPLGQEPSVWAECLFVNPVADIAVLSSPDDQELSDEFDDYEALMESTTPMRIAETPENARGWMLSLDGEWFSATLKHVNDGSFWVSDTTQPIAAGMSGSPIVSDSGAAIGVVALADDTGTNEYGSENPRLTRDLPDWILRACLPMRSKRSREIL